MAGPNVNLDSVSNLEDYFSVCSDADFRKIMIAFVEARRKEILNNSDLTLNNEIYIEKLDEIKHFLSFLF